MNKDRMASIEAMTKTLHWKKFIKEIEEDFTLISGKLAVDEYPEESIEFYKNQCRAYNVLMNLVKVEQNKTKMELSQAKVRKEVY